MVRDLLLLSIVGIMSWSSDSTVADDVGDAMHIVTVEVKNGTGRITINRPESLNSLRVSS